MSERAESKNPTIAIRYKLSGSEAWDEMHLAPEEYFESEDGVKNWADAIPRYNDTINYLAAEARASVEKISLEVADPAAGTVEKAVEVFWNGGRNQIVEVTRCRGTEKSSEVIVSTRIKEVPPIVEIIRFRRLSAELSVSFHVLVRDNPDGTQSELKIYPRPKEPIDEDQFFKGL